jgi:hypothetical protein
MTDMLNTPPRVVKPTDKIIIDDLFHLSRFDECPPKINKCVLEMIVDEFKAFVINPFYRPTHELFLNNYFDSQKNNRRRPSTFMIYDLKKQKSQTWYNGIVYESYTNVKYGKTLINLEFDEIRQNSSRVDMECNDEECDCCFNYKKYPIFKQNRPLFTQLLSQIKVVLTHDKPSEYDEILDNMYNTTNWIYMNMEHYNLNTFYKITYKNKPYYISYVLLGIYVFTGRFDDPILEQKKKTTLIDPILRVLQTCCEDFHDEVKDFTIKTGLYYVEITEYLPQIEYKNMGIKSNLTYGYYKSQIYTDLPIITIPKIKLVKKRSIKYNNPTQYTTKIEAYDNDTDEVVIGYFKTTIIYNSFDKVMRPSIIPKIIIKNYTTPIILEPPIIIQPQLKPLHVIFKHGITNIDKIRKMLNDCYTSSHSFREHSNKYKTIKIVKGIHHDFNRLDKSLHFTAVFINPTEESSVFHMYIVDNKIISITTIINIL